jgi:hypothetical protein
MVYDRFAKIEARPFFQAAFGFDISVGHGERAAESGALFRRLAYGGHALGEARVFRGETRSGQSENSDPHRGEKGVKFHGSSYPFFGRKQPAIQPGRRI